MTGAALQEASRVTMVDMLAESIMANLQAYVKDPDSEKWAKEAQKMDMNQSMRLDTCVRRYLIDLVREQQTRGEMSETPEQKGSLLLAEQRTYQIYTPLDKRRYVQVNDLWCETRKTRVGEQVQITGTWRYILTDTKGRNYVQIRQATRQPPAQTPNACVCMREQVSVEHRAVFPHLPECSPYTLAATPLVPPTTPVSNKVAQQGNSRDTQTKATTQSTENEHRTHWTKLVQETGRETFVRILEAWPPQSTRKTVGNLKLINAIQEVLKEIIETHF